MLRWASCRLAWDVGPHGKDEVSEELGSSFGERVGDSPREGNIQGQLQRGTLSLTAPQLLPTGR